MNESEDSTSYPLILSSLLTQSARYSLNLVYYSKTVKEEKEKLNQITFTERESMKGEERWMRVNSGRNLLILDPSPLPLTEQ